MNRRVKYGRMAENIKAIRTSRGLTQKQLAAATGVSQPTVSAIERGAHASVKTGSIKAIADELGVCHVCLQCEDATPEMLIDGTLCQMTHLFCAASADGRDFLLSAARREVR